MISLSLSVLLLFARVTSAGVDCGTASLPDRIKDEFSRVVCFGFLSIGGLLVDEDESSFV